MADAGRETYLEFFRYHVSVNRYSGLVGDVKSWAQDAVEGDEVVVPHGIVLDRLGCQEGLMLEVRSKRCERRKNRLVQQARYIEQRRDGPRGSKTIILSSIIRRGALP